MLDSVEALAIAEKPEQVLEVLSSPHCTATLDQVLRKLTQLSHKPTYAHIEQLWYAAPGPELELLMGYVSAILCPV